MKITLLLLLLASPSQAKGMKGLRLPKGVIAEWVIPPTKAKKGRPVSFAVDLKGHVWFGFGEAAFAPQKNVLFRADSPVDQLLWHGMLQLVRSGNTLGRFTPTDQPSKGMARVHFKPLSELPFTQWRMAQGSGDEIIVAGYNPKKKLSQIAEIGPKAGPDGFKLIYNTEAQISDVAKIGKKVYFAAGGAIWEIPSPGRPPKVYYARTKHSVRRIVAKPGTGLFFAAKDSIGFAGPNAQFDFFKCSKCRIALTGDSLYILLGRVSKGVLRLRGVSIFGRL